MRTTTLALFLIAASAAPVLAQDAERRDVRKTCEDLRRLRAELRLETNAVVGHLRGFFGRRPARPDWTPRTAGKGRLDVVDGVPVLYLEGTPEEMGRQHGTLLKNEVRAMSSYVRSYVGKRRLPRARSIARETFGEHWPADHAAEAKALARAAELDEEEVLFAQAFTDLYRAFACSTLSSPSPEGAYLARNLDFPSMGYLERYSIVVVAKPKGKLPFVSVSWPGLIGVLSGQNAGFALSVMVVHDEHGAAPGVPFQLAFRRLLEEAETTAGAESLMRSMPVTVSNNLMLVDTAGDARVLELHQERIVSRKAGKPGLITSTNHHVSPDLERNRMSITYRSSRDRYETVQAVCKAGKPVALDAAKRALGEAAIPFTVQSMVFLPKAGAVEVNFARRAPVTKNGRYVRLGAEVLLGR